MLRILLDENLPVPMRRLFPLHEIDHVKKRGWDGISNGRLIALADAEGFDVLVTADKNLRHQQNLAGRRLALVVLGTNRWASIRQGAARVVAAVDEAQSGTLQEVEFSRPSGRRPSGELP